MTALDDAERLLVSGSFERAKSEAAAARKDARSTSERVASECVWIQAEYKLGGLTRHDLDAARMVTGFGEEFHRASVLLWSRLRLADPTDPAEAEAAAEEALTRIFERTLADRRKPKEDGGQGRGDRAQRRVALRRPPDVPTPGSSPGCEGVAHEPRERRDAPGGCVADTRRRGGGIDDNLGFHKRGRTRR